MKLSRDVGDCYGEAANDPGVCVNVSVPKVVLEHWHSLKNCTFNVSRWKCHKKSCPERTAFVAWGTRGLKPVRPI